MPRFKYAGQHPVPDGEGGLVKPGDIRDTEPDFGPWDEIPGEDDGPGKPAEPKATPVPPAAPARPATASTTPPATTPAPAAEGN